jgi:ubiquitin-protein ligase
MEEISNQECLNKIHQWSTNNNKLLTIESCDNIDASTIKLGLNYINQNYINLYTNYSLDYFFVESSNTKKSLKEDFDSIIVSINYFIFNQENINLEDILNTIKKYLTNSDSQLDQNHSEDFEDKYNVGLSHNDNASFLMRKNWELKDKEIRKNNTNVNYFNIPKNLLYSSDIIFSIVSNEIFKLSQKKSTNYKIIISEDNIYDFKVQLKYPNSELLNNQLRQVKKLYGYDFIEIKISLNMNLYPFFPPSIQIVRPKINNSIVYAIMDLEFLKHENWNPTNNLEFVINALSKVFEQHASIHVESKLNNLEQSYLPLEYCLMKLSSKYKLLSQASEDIDVEYTKLSANSLHNNDTTTNTYWKSGVGYGHTNRKEWDINAYIKDQERIDKELSEEINAITNEIISFHTTDIKDIVQPSCLFTLIKNRLLGITLMEIDKNTNIYTSIIHIIKVITQNNLWKIDHTFSQIVKSINNISKESESIIKIISDTKSDQIIDPIYTDIIAINDILSKIDISNTSLKIASSENDTIQTVYTDQMKPLLFSTMDIINDTSVEYKFRGQKSISNYDPKSLMRIVKEISTLSSSLPISYSSTVFMKTDENNINNLKFMITGPKGTPYESGCFEFDTIFTPEFPNSPPKVLLLTTGGGKVRFNPNLYNCGKVCLSLLGTWSGQKGESWNKDTSTFLQVLVSIQSLIMVDEPYYNEPGWERYMNSPEGDKRSFNYNDNIRINTLKWGILNQLKNPSKGFEEIIKKHFYYKKNTIFEQLDKWHSEATNKEEFNKYLKETKELIENLKV